MRLYPDVVAGTLEITTQHQQQQVVLVGVVQWWPAKKRKAK